MTLLLLLTSSGVVDLEAVATVSSTSGTATDPERRASKSPATAVSALSATAASILVPLSAVATSHVITSLNFLPYDTTVSASAALPFESSVASSAYESTRHTASGVSCETSVAGAPESRTADQPAAFVGGVGNLTGNGYQQNQYPSASVPGVSGGNLLLYLSTEVATALVHEISSFNFLPFDSTVDFSALFSGSSTVGGNAYDSTRHTDGVVPAVFALVGSAEDRLALQPNAITTTGSGLSANPYDTTQHFDAILSVVSGLVITVPSRSFAVAAGAGGGRAGVGSLADGGGRTTSGSAGSGTGRNTTGTVT